MMLIERRAFLGAGLALPFALPAHAALTTVKVGQATAALSFLKVFAVQALGTLPAEQLGMEFTIIRGGDPAALAAIDSEDIDLAAVGSDTPLAAAAKGQPFQIVYSLMSKFPYELTVSTAFLKKSGLSPEAPLKERLGALKTAIVGVTAIGGAQDRVARWMAVRGGLDPKDVKLATIGATPALGAALESGQIDAFVLSPPESVIAEAQGYGKVIVRPAREMEGIKGIPSLVFVAKANPDAARRQRIVSTLRATNKAAQMVVADPDGTADKIGAKFFPKIAPEIIRASFRSLIDGLGGDGSLNDEAVAALRRFSTETGGAAPRNDDFWTNAYVAEAAGK